MSRKDKENIEEELPVFVGLNQLYNSIRPIYEADFANTDYEHFDNYENAYTHPCKYLHVSYRVLQVSSSLPDLQINLWSLIPQGSHSIVHVPISGTPALNHLFKKVHANNLLVLDSCIHSGVFISQIDYQVLCSRQAPKRDLWNAVFDLRRIEDGGMQLTFGMKTDEHMISVLLEKTAINIIPQNIKDTTARNSQKYQQLDQRFLSFLQESFWYY